MRVSSEGESTDLRIYRVELGRVPSEDNEADPGTKCLERERIKKCVTKMEMLFAGAWAGEQLLVVSSTEVLILGRT